jgi:hypothetical protein
MDRPDVRGNINEDVAGHAALRARLIDQALPYPVEADPERGHHVGERYSLLGPFTACFLRCAHVSLQVLAHRPEHEFRIRAAGAPQILRTDFAAPGVEVDAGTDLPGDVPAEFIERLEQLPGQGDQFGVMDRKGISVIHATSLGFRGFAVGVPRTRPGPAGARDGAEQAGPRHVRGLVRPPLRSR